MKIHLFLLLIMNVFMFVTATTAFAQTTLTSGKTLEGWKKDFGQCLNDNTYYSRSIVKFNEIAQLKYALQLENIDQIQITGDDVSWYQKYVQSTLDIAGLTALIRDVNQAALDIGNNYFDEQFKDPIFQDLASSHDFSLLDVITSVNFKNPNINQDSRIVELFSGMNEGKLKYAKWAEAWTKLENHINKNLVPIKFALSVIHYYSEYFDIKVSLLDPNLAKDLLIYSSSVKAALQIQGLQDLNSVTEMKQIPLPTNLINNAYANIANEFVGRIVSRRLRNDDPNNKTPVIQISAEQIDNIRKKKNLSFVAKTLAALDKQGIKGNQNIVNYLNKTLKPSGFAFDEFLIRRNWSKNPNDIALNDIIPTLENKLATYQQLAAIDGMARTLVGEAGLCQQNGAHQFEAIGLIFAKRAQSIADTMTMAKTIKEQGDSDLQFNQQIAILFDKNQRADYQKITRNNLKGISDFGRKDKNGRKLDPVAQALSAPRQFDTWQSTRSQTLKLNELIGRIPKNFYNIEFEIPTAKPEEEQGVYKTVLCPLGNPDLSRDKFYTNYLDSRTKIFNEALEISKEVVLNRDQFLKRYHFFNKSSNSSQGYNRTLFYTHGIKLGFATQVFPSYISKTDLSTNKSTPLSITIPGGKSVGSCNKIMFFNPKDANAPYFLK